MLNWDIWRFFDRIDDNLFEKSYFITSDRRSRFCAFCFGTDCLYSLKLFYELIYFIFSFDELLLLLDDLFYSTYSYSKLKDRVFICYIGNLEFLLEFLKKPISSFLLSSLLKTNYFEPDILRRSPPPITFG